MIERRVISRDRSAGGFTLLEIGIALVVLALAFSLALPGLEAVTGARMRSAAGHLSSSMRALYSEAALTGRTCRIAFNLDDRSYAVECALEQKPAELHAADIQLRAKAPKDRAC